jgi:uncharacterized protein
MYFEIANIDVSPWVPPLTAFGVSFFASMGGISGAFLLLPFQMSALGYVNPSVSATNQFFNIVAIPSGVCRYVKEGRMVWPLAWIVVVGTLPGVFLGAFIRVAYLPDARNFKLFAAAVLGYVGLRLLCDLISKKRGSGQPMAGKQAQDALRRDGKRNERACVASSKAKVISFSLSRLTYEFNHETFFVSTVGVFSLSLAVGVVGGVYGIGGGAIIAPFLVSVYRLPIYTIAGAALLGTLVTSVAGVGFYQVIAPFFPGLSVAPDWLLGTLFGVGGMVGMYLGARCQKHVPAILIKWMLAAVIMATAARYVSEYFSIVH